MSDMPNDPTILMCDVPDEIIKASITVSRYFAERGYKTWTLGGCSNRADKPADKQGDKERAGKIIRSNRALDWFDSMLDFCKAEFGTKLLQHDIENAEFIRTALSGVAPVVDLEALDNAGSWMSAALDDPKVCQKCKDDFSKALEVIQQLRERNLMSLTETSEDLLDPDMPAQELHLHMGELTPSEELVARSAIRWANTRVNPADQHKIPDTHGRTATVRTATDEDIKNIWLKNEDK